MVEPPVLVGGDHVRIGFPSVAVMTRSVGAEGLLDNIVTAREDVLVAPSLSVTVKVTV